MEDGVSDKEKAFRAMEEAGDRATRQVAINIAAGLVSNDPETKKKAQEELDDLKARGSEPWGSSNFKATMIVDYYLEQMDQARNKLSPTKAARAPK